MGQKVSKTNCFSWKCESQQARENYSKNKQGFKNVGLITLFNNLIYKRALSRIFLLGDIKNDIKTQYFIVMSIWYYVPGTLSLRPCINSLKPSAIRDFPDHATFREKSVTTGLVGQA